MSTDADDNSLPLRIEQAATAYRESKARFEDDREQLFDAILDGLDAQATDGTPLYGPSAVARFAGFTREYIARIRDGKVKRLRERL
ncbi:hypothetical protein [Nocardia sp. NPDC059195]|uniref:hypothetical protein n=1 Tax=Nocardia sp. NPDC059195 TaxID=3346765 RepID=UPI003684F6AB